MYPESRILILGSMPSVASLDAQEYYGFKHNAFWWLISRLVGQPAEQHIDIEYSIKLAWIKSLQLAVWDVFSDCEREGSLDSAINFKTAAINNFEFFLSNYPSIEAIFFNGKTAEKHFLKAVDKSLLKTMQLQVMPSTSPANARMSKQEKLDLWQSAYQRIISNSSQ